MKIGRGVRWVPRRRPRSPRSPLDHASNVVTYPILSRCARDDGYVCIPLRLVRFVASHLGHELRLFKLVASAGLRLSACRTVSTIRSGYLREDGRYRNRLSPPILLL